MKNPFYNRHMSYFAFFSPHFFTPSLIQLMPIFSRNIFFNWKIKLLNLYVIELNNFG